MEEIDGVSSALVNRNVTLLMAVDEAPDREALAKILKEFKMEVRDMQKAPALPF